MKRALLFLMGCSQGYDNNDLELLTQYRARELCSCLFVEQQTEAYCVAYTVAAPNLATFQIDYARKAVQSEALFMWGARAHLDDNERFGCVLDK